MAPWELTRHESIVGHLRLYLLASSWSAAGAACQQGAYVSARGDYVVVVPQANSQPPAQRYLFRDGRRGTVDATVPFTCLDNAVSMRKNDGTVERRQEMPLTITDTQFVSVETQLAGRLIEPGGGVVNAPPLVVMVHGSERTSPLNSVYAYSLAAQGISVFVYDKRGTVASEGSVSRHRSRHGGIHDQ